MEQKEKKARVRSPNYPSIPLDRGIELIEVLFKNQNRYPVALEVAAKDWSFSPKSGHLLQIVAALASYKLVDIEGEKEARRLKISEHGFKIVIDKRPDSCDRKALIRESALTPNIFRVICEEYPDGLPVDHTLEYELVTKYKFNPASIKDFISIFRKTIEFANIYNLDIMGSQDNAIEEPSMPVTDKAPSKEQQWAVVPTLSIGSKEREIANYPIGRGLKARILVSGDSLVTIDSIEKLITLLGVNKEDLPEVIDHAEPEKS